MAACFEIFYVSVCEIEASQIADIVRKARANNAKCGVTGMLVYDGCHFAQYMEGEEKQVTRIMGRIYEDRRHDHIRVVLHGERQQRLLSDWAMGYLVDLDCRDFLSDVWEGKRDVESIERLIDTWKAGGAFF